MEVILTKPSTYTHICVLMSVNVFTQSVELFRHTLSHVTHTVNIVIVGSSADDESRMCICWYTILERLPIMNMEKYLL